MTRWLQYLESRSRASLLSLTLFSVAVVGVIDYLTGVELSFSIFYLLPVALSAWLISRWAGVIISTVSAVVWYLVDLISSPSYSSPIVPYWNATVMLGLFLTTALILSALRRAVDRENKLAREIQQGLLPKAIPDIKGYEIAGAWLPARSVGGDYYDVLHLDDDSVALCIGDAAGHGIPAALLVSNLQAAVRILAPAKLPPRDLCTELNRFVLDNTTSAKFITFFYGLLDLAKRELVYTNAGHNPPIVFHRGGTIVQLADGGFPLGFQSEARYDQGKIRLEDGDLLLIYTDGALETRNLQNEEFGEERFLKLLQENHLNGARTACDRILRAVSEFSKGNRRDDLTLLVLYAGETGSS
jgi:serine phosphatase RsbU (regulator of sigma subunit)